MKHIINYLGALLAVVLIGATFTACSEDDKDSANVGLGIKTFFPTKVVTNQPMTINGSGFADVTKIEFPGDIEVTNFEIVSNEMIRVNAPAGISAEGGKIKVETSGDEAESNQSLTIGHTSVTGFSKQPGDEANGGDLIEVYGSDLEFINKIELLDADGETQFVDHKDFYRKGTSQLMFRVPLKNIFEGTFVGYLHTYDGQKIALPELAYKPASDGGHWESVKTIIWENDGSHGNLNWGGDYRFAPESNSTGEEIYTVPQDVWDKMKSGSFYLLIQPNADWYNVRVTNGWWQEDWNVGDIGKGNERLIDNGDGTFYLEINFTEDAKFLGAVDQKHLLFTGEGYTPLQLYFLEDVWVGGDGHMEIQESTIWDTETVFADWSATILIGPEKFADVKDGAVVRVYIKDKGSDYNPIFKHENWSDWTEFQSIKTDGDGYFESTVTADVIAELQEKGLRFQGLGFTITKVTLTQEVWVGGGGDATSEFDLSKYVTNHDGSSISYPYTFTWGDNGRFNLSSELLLNEFKVKKGSIFRVTKEAGNTGQVQINNTSWTDIDYLKDWDGSVEVMEKVFDDAIMEAVNNGGLIIQGDLKGVTKISIVP